MRDLSEIGMRQRPSSGHRAAPTDAEIGAFESAFSVRLPRDYVAFLRYCNGGHPQLEFCPIPGQSDNFGVSASIFYFLNSSEKNSSENLWYETLLHQNELGAKQIPIADDGLGNQIVLDCSTAIPCVLALLHDSEVEKVVVAPTFGEFVDRLSEANE